MPAITPKRGPPRASAVTLEPARPVEETLPVSESTTGVSVWVTNPNATTDASGNIVLRDADGSVLRNETFALAPQSTVRELDDVVIPLNRPLSVTITSPDPLSAVLVADRADGRVTAMLNGADASFLSD